jgi:hypothetical protein
MNYTITIGILGIPLEQLEALIKQSVDRSETQKKLIAELEQKLALNQRQVQAALAILGEANIAPEHLGSKLVEVTERFKDLQAAASPQPGDDPKVAALKIEADTAIDAGNLAHADALLASIEAEQRRSLDRLAVSAAATLGQRDPLRRGHVLQLHFGVSDVFEASKGLAPCNALSALRHFVYLLFHCANTA